jgi:hypothetical protein
VMNHADKCKALTALAVVGFLKVEVAKYTTPAEASAAMVAVLGIARTAVTSTPDLGVLVTLTYPTPEGG